MGDMLEQKDASGVSLAIGPSAKVKRCILLFCHECGTQLIGVLFAVASERDSCSCSLRRAASHCLLHLPAMGMATSMLLIVALFQHCDTPL